MNKYDFVYHASKIHGLKNIEPRVSTHEKSWVYAMEKPEYSLLFIGNHSDLINQIGFINDTLEIVERFEGALEYAYKNLSGSIYTLDSNEFKKGMTSFNIELICDHVCEVINEEKIEDVLKAILKLEQENKIRIYRYPDHPNWIPSDKSDLIKKCIEWGKMPGNTILENVARFHPDILDEVRDGISLK